MLRYYIGIYIINYHENCIIMNAIHVTINFFSCHLARASYQYKANTIRHNKINRYIYIVYIKLLLTRNFENNVLFKHQKY
jgi:hypothetical protein